MREFIISKLNQIKDMLQATPEDSSKDTLNDLINETIEKLEDLIYELKN